jgi:CheY-like chemotaxis protein
MSINTLLSVNSSKIANSVILETMTLVFPEWITLEASSSNQALEKANTTTIQWAFIDYDLPDTTGMELAINFRLLYPGSRITLLARKYNPEIHGLAAQMNVEILYKPVDERGLLSLLPKSA